MGVGEVQAEEAIGRGVTPGEAEAPVRRVRADEWALLRETRLRALATDPRAFGATLEEESALPEDEWRARAAGAPGRVALVAERGGRWAGIASARDDGGAVEVLGLWVAPEARGLGVGRALLEAAGDWAKARGAARLVLWVNGENAHALRLYEACGYARLSGPHQGKRDPSRWFWMMGRSA